MKIKSVFIVLSLMFFGLMFFTVGCQENNEKEDTSLDPNKICDSNSEYCLTSMSKNEDIVFFNECVPKPANCNSCECMESDAKTYFEKSNNCSQWISCFEKGGKHTVTCYVPDY